jgi:hypothetical protein
MTVRKFLLGDVVVNLRPFGWRTGTIVLVVPAGRSVRREARKAGKSVRNFGAGVGVRDHESYVVEDGGGGLYHPSVWRIEKRPTIDDMQKVANKTMRRIFTGMGLKEAGGGK